MINDLRKQIDKIDADMVKLLAARMELSKQIGREKAATGAEIHQKTREIEVLDKVKLVGDSLGLADSFMTDVYSTIFTESRRIQASE